jgi:hypothetical protein
MGKTMWSYTPAHGAGDKLNSISLAGMIWRSFTGNSKTLMKNPVIYTSERVYFVSRKSEITDTLFAPLRGGTASGYYKTVKGGIRFHHPTGECFAFLVANRYGERFFVSCGKQSDGRVFYSYALAEKGRQILGLPESLIKQHEIASTIWNMMNPVPTWDTARQTII